MRIQIKDIAYHLPERIETIEMLTQENPDWDMEVVKNRTGVFTRHIAGMDETALDLAIEACDKLFSQNEGLAEKIDGILFCTESGDYPLPPNSCILHKKLGLSEDVFATDFNLACSGYVYGLSLAQGLILSKAASNILLVTADTYSKYINEKDRSVKVLFGDGAAVSWISAADSAGGMIAIRCATSGEGYERFIVPAGGCRQPKSEETSRPVVDNHGDVRTLEEIHMDGKDILMFVMQKVPKQVNALLKKNEMTVADIDLFIFHQASKMVLDTLQRVLRIPPEKNYRNLPDIGNTVSASIPIAIKDAQDQGKLSPGDRLLLSGFGVGLSWGTAIIEI